MKIRVAEDAAGDLENIPARIAIESEVTAAQTIEHTRINIRALGKFPHLGHEGIVTGTFERVVSRTQYVIVYRIDLRFKKELIVLRVFQFSQERSRYRY